MPQHPHSAIDNLSVAKHNYPPPLSQDTLEGKMGTPPTDRDASQDKQRPAAQAQLIQKAAPRYQLNPPPEYPRIARRRGLEGTVIIKVLVDNNGGAVKTIVAATSGYAVLDKAAQKNVRSWVFRPGTINGRKQAMWVEVPIKFQLK